mgnify:CR=1 FL=1
MRCVYGWRSFADVDILVFRLATTTEGRRIQLGDLPHSPATEFPKHGGSMNSGVCVSNLAPTSKFVCTFQASDGVRGGRKIYTGSDRTSLHPVINGLHYLHH